MGFDLTGRVVFVSGGAGDIGSAIVRGFAAEGCHILVGDIDPDAAAKLAAEIGAEHPSAHLEAHTLDVTDNASIQTAVTHCHRLFGRLDVLVNVAGVLNRKSVFEIEKADFEQSLSVNVMGAFFLSQAAARIMREQGEGRIINISSLNGTAAAENRAVYGASKAALDMLTRSLAVELGAFGITVNSVAPGVVDSKMSRVRLNNPDIINTFTKYIPLGRLVLPEDVCGSVLFLASSYAACISGDILLVDGGIIARQALPKF